MVIRAEIHQLFYHFDDLCRRDAADHGMQHTGRQLRA